MGEGSKPSGNGSSQHPTIDFFQSATPILGQWWLPSVHKLPAYPNIRRWEFVELNQLLSDNLISVPTPLDTEGDTKSKEKRKLHPITNIQSWYFLMFLYTATIQATYPHKTGELLAYMATVVPSPSQATL